MVGVTDFTFGNGGDPISLRQAFELINQNFDAVTKVIMPAGENIPPNSVCYINPEGLAMLAGSNIAESIDAIRRFTVDGGSIDSQVQLYRGGNTVCLPNSTIEPGFYWMGENGTLTTDFPTIGYSTLVGEVSRVQEEIDGMMTEQTFLTLTLGVALQIV